MVEMAISELQGGCIFKHEISERRDLLGLLIQIGEFEPRANNSNLIVETSIVCIALAGQIHKQFGASPALIRSLLKDQATSTRMGQLPI